MSEEQASSRSPKNENKMEVKINVPTVIQMYSWDCGLACVSMILRSMQLDTRNVYTQNLEDLECGERIWTIDLAYLVHMYNIRHTFCTITLGVDKTYNSKAFYRVRFETDENRVNQMFEQASKRGIQVEKRSVTMEDLVSHLRGNNLVICLVDWNSLECIWCDNMRKNCIKCFARLGCCNDFQGHYVVLCGYDLKHQRLYYKNPNFEEDMCCTSMTSFDRARMQHGTDEDTLFIFNHPGTGEG
ncbi:hypothetical protein ScPMuIL_006409 [Solemya velum]